MLKKRQAELVFQSPNRFRHRRLANGKRFRSARKASLFRYLEERAEEMKIHGHSAVPEAFPRYVNN